VGYSVFADESNPFSPRNQAAREEKIQEQSLFVRGASIFIHVLRFICMVFLSFVTLLDVITDIWTIALYFDKASNSTTLSEHERHMVGVYAILGLALLVFALRSYFVLFTVTSDHRTLIFTEGDLCRNLYLLVPFVGEPLSAFLYDTEPPTVGVMCVCKWICLELSLFALVLATPLCIIYVAYRNIQIAYRHLCNRVNFYRQQQLNREERKLLRVSIRNTSSRRHKYKKQIIVLKFVECVFEAIPMLILQCYVLMTYEGVYKHESTDIVFVSSVLTAMMAMVRTAYEFLMRFDNIKTLFD